MFINLNYFLFNLSRLNVRLLNLNLYLNYYHLMNYVFKFNQNLYLIIDY